MPDKKNKPAISASYQIICIFSCISKVIMKNVFLITWLLLLHFIPTSHKIAYQPQTVQLFNQDQFESVAELFLCVKQSIII